MELDAGIAVQIGDIVKGNVDTIHKRMDKSTTPKPIRRRFGGSAVAVANQVTNVQTFPICASGRMWVIRKVGIFGNDVHTPVGTGIATIATGNAAAAGNGSATLPVNEGLSQFTLSFGSVGTANNLAVTVTGAQGGTLTYSVSLAAGQNNPFVVDFPVPLQAVSGSQIAVNVTGNTNSPATSITAYGVAASSVTADIYAGSLQDENTADFQGAILSAVPIPTIKDYGNRHITLYAQDQVYALVTGAAANQQFVLTGEADEYILDEVEAVHIPEARKPVQ